LEKDEARSGFLGFVAHELRNPLSTALWSAELLVRLSPEERGAARGEKLSGMCLRALQRLRLLIEDHFLAERLGVGGIPFRVEEVRLREAVEAVSGKAAADFAAEIDPALVVASDRSLTERALESLIACAARGNTPVRLRAAVSGGEVTVTVHGAPPQPDAFAIPQKGTPSDPTGRALALHMVARIAETLGGRAFATEHDYVMTWPALRAAPSSDDT
jgi:signal transduction histidine kinase